VCAISAAAAKQRLSVLINPKFATQKLHGAEMAQGQLETDQGATRGDSTGHKPEIQPK